MPGGYTKPSWINNLFIFVAADLVIFMNAGLSPMVLEADVPAEECRQHLPRIYVFCTCPQNGLLVPLAHSIMYGNAVIGAGFLPTGQNFFDLR